MLRKHKKNVIIFCPLFLLLCFAVYLLFNMFNFKKVLSPVEYLNHIKADYLLVNTTNKWLAETADLKENAVYTLTGFSGDTGEAILMRTGEIKLFVGGRDYIQAQSEVKDVVKLIQWQKGQSFFEEIAKNMYSGSTLAIVSSKISVARYEVLKKYLDKRNIKVILLNKDPVNDYTLKTSKKFEKVDYEPKKLNLEQDVLITNLDDVSYLTGLRSFDKEGSSKIYAKLFIDRQGKYTLFTDRKKFEKFIEQKNQKDEEIAIDKTTMSLYDYNLIKNPIEQEAHIVSKLKSIKTNDEIVDLQNAFEISDKSLLEVRDYIEKSKSGSLSEDDIYKKLIKTFYKNGAKGLSFEPIVAINKNSTQAHYSKHSKDVYLHDGDLVLIDCGVYGKNGLATDTTRVFVKGQPTKLQKQVYTLVLKAFLNAYKNTQMNGYELNELAHKILDNQIKGNVRQNNTDLKDDSNETNADDKISKLVDNIDNYFIFNHGLGHGIGVSVHEFPPSLASWDGAKQPILDNMCFTIEPGLYHKDFFGIRLENSFYRKKNKNISFVKVGFESKLIDFDTLTDEEREILKEFGLI